MKQVSDEGRLTPVVARRLAWSLTGAAIALAAATVVFAVLGNSTWQDLQDSFVPMSLLMVVSFSFIGALIVARRSANVIGWLLIAIAVPPSISSAASQYSLWAWSGQELPGVGIAVWLDAWAWAPSNGLFLVFLPLLFPDGRPPSPRWRWVGWVAAAVISVQTLLSALAAWPHRGGGRLLDLDTEAIDGPVMAVAVQLQALVPILGVVAAGSLVMRYRRAGGDERQQVKWLAYASAVSAVTLVTVSFAQLALLPAAFLLAVVLVAGAVAVAILRYRLYDIDVVITKTMVFGSLAAFITAVYVAIVVGIGSLFGASVERPSGALSIVATAVVAVAFQPVRARVQRLANRLVYGKRATPYEVMADFAGRLSDVLSIDEVPSRMAEAAAQSVGCERVRVMVRLPDGGSRSVVWPRDGSEDGRWDRRMVVSHQGRQVGEVAVAMPTDRPLMAGDVRLLDDLSAQAGVALHQVALTSQLQARLADISAQAAELRASRQRIVAARDAERRRMEREIHDGAEQQLVAIAAKLTLAERALEQDPARAVEHLSELAADAQATLNGLRDLARGIFPPLLVDQGLVAALDAHIRKHELQATIIADPAVSAGRFSDQAEVATYFCCLEALHNGTRHAPGSAITLRLTLVGGELQFSVTDDGPGFDRAAAPRGTGLQNMEDRVEAIGGTLRIDSTRGGGTTVVGGIPVAAVKVVR